MRGIHDVAVTRQGPVRRFQRLDRPTKVARDERYLRLGDHAASARHGFSWTERPRRAAQQHARALEIAELRHGDAAKRERRCVITQRHTVQRAKWIASRERTGSSEDHRVHQNHVTVVTHTIGCGNRTLSLAATDTNTNTGENNGDNDCTWDP